VFLRYIDIKAESRSFCRPLSFLPCLWVNLFEFLDELYVTQVRVIGIFAAEDFVILAYIVLTRYHLVTHEQTDLQTCRQQAVAVLA